MAKLWGGRFKKSLDEAAKRYSFSTHVDGRLALCDIRLNRVHSEALMQVGILSEQEFGQLCACLDELYTQFSEENPGLIETEDEDIHSCIERLVIAKLGDLGKKMHTGKSRNDQVATDTRMFLKEEIRIIQQRIRSVLHGLGDLAEEHVSVIFPGFTHLQAAQPVILAHHLLAYFNMFERDLQRLDEIYKRVDVCPLGSGAMAGNNYGLDRHFVAEKLGFSAITTNSMDAVSDRDYILEFISAAAISMMHLSRFCEELIIWSSPLVAFVKIGDDFTTGSSIMPQKKNPDIAELIRGKTSRLLAAYTGMHELMKGLPLTYNRDMQDDKIYLFDAIDVWSSSLLVFAKMLATLTFNGDAIEKSLNAGYLLATDFADYLVKKGVPFRESHEVTGRVVSFAEDQGQALEALSLADFRSFCEHIDADVFDVLKLSASVAAKNSVGATAEDQVKAQLKRLKEIYQWNKR